MEGEIDVDGVRQERGRWDIRKKGVSGGVSDFGRDTWREGGRERW